MTPQGVVNDIFAALLPILLAASLIHVGARIVREF